MDDVTLHAIEVGLLIAGPILAWAFKMQGEISALRLHISDRFATIQYLKDVETRLGSSITTLQSVLTETRDAVISLKERGRRKDDIENELFHR